MAVPVPWPGLRAGHSPAVALFVVSPPSFTRPSTRKRNASAPMWAPNGPASTEGAYVPLDPSLPLSPSLPASLCLSPSLRTHAVRTSAMRCGPYSISKLHRVQCCAVPCAACKRCVVEEMQRGLCEESENQRIKGCAVPRAVRGVWWTRWLWRGLCGSSPKIQDSVMHSGREGAIQKSRDKQGERVRERVRERKGGGGRGGGRERAETRVATPVHDLAQPKNPCAWGAFGDTCPQVPTKRDRSLWPLQLELRGRWGTWPELKCAGHTLDLHAHVHTSRHGLHSCV